MTEKMQFTLVGFTQVGAFRVFTFENAGAKSARTQFSVRANITLIVKYAIHLQELPLLCRGLLERLSGPEGILAFTFTEEEMAAHATSAAAVRRDAALRRKPPRRPPNANLGPAWRGAPVPAQMRPFAGNGFSPSIVAEPTRQSMTASRGASTTKQIGMPMPTVEESAGSE